MLIALLIALVALWILGYIHIPVLNAINFDIITIFNRTITVVDVLMFLVIVWLIGLLPNPFKQIAGVLFILWLLSLFGIITIAGISLSQLLIVGLIVGLAIYIFAGL
jgi:hypothetical protein